MDKQYLEKISDYIWQVPKTYREDMRVDVRFFASDNILDEIMNDKSLEQLVNVATLPGICKFALAMPDMHEGYGFPVGGVAGFLEDTGIISPGGIGYDINCGVRLLASDMFFDDVKDRLSDIAREIFRQVPSGVGRGGRYKIEGKEMDKVLENGAHHLVQMGYGREEDLECIESSGKLFDADPKYVSDKAKKRGKDQLGTMGAGNHFVEVEKVENIFDENIAQEIGLFKDQVVVLIHTGSRGLGHQVATDYIRLMMTVMEDYGIHIPDRELACCPFQSREGQEYLKAMSAAANFAWANRQMITFEVRQAWKNIFGNNNLKVIYDVAHNIAKIEEYEVDGRMQKVVVHRKGATRAFPDQVVLIPGSMGTGSYVLIGQKESLKYSFGSTCHGAGRRMSRRKAKDIVRGADLKQELRKKGIAVSAGSMSGLAEEAPIAYKDVDDVVDVVHRIGIAKKLARLSPIAVCKG